MRFWLETLEAEGETKAYELRGGLGWRNLGDFVKISITAWAGNPV